MDANAQEITGLVADLVASDWPTTESERLAWRTSVGTSSTSSSWASTSSGTSRRTCLIWSPSHVMCGKACTLWETTEELEDKVQGFTALWHPRDKVVDMYWHAPRLMPEGHRSTGTIQLHVDHRDRSDARNRHDESLQPDMN